MKISKNIGTDKISHRDKKMKHCQQSMKHEL